MPAIWKFGNDVNTDVITPGRYNLSTDPDYLARYCFIEERPNYPEEVEEGDILVGGENFGCGSSRETAPVAIKASGVGVVIAKSFARIFFRNAVNIGLPIMICPEAEIGEDDTVDYDLESGRLSVNGVEFEASPLPDFALDIVRAGGIVNYLNRHSGFPDSA